MGRKQRSKQEYNNRKRSRAKAQDSQRQRREYLRKVDALIPRLRRETGVGHIHTKRYRRFGMKDQLILKLSTWKTDGERTSSEDGLYILREFQKELPELRINYEIGSYGGKVR